MYPILALVFLLSIIIGALSLAGLVFKPKVWVRNRSKINIFLICWFVPYATFIVLFTGPEDLDQYPPRENSPYKLPWDAGVNRILSQGNRSFTSHRSLHRYAWDFVMPNGTEILASREGVVLEIEQSYSTVGLTGNYVLIEHEDGHVSGYFHIEEDGVLVDEGDEVAQGQPIARSGMTGQTTLPHLHFVVFNSDQSQSIPISFQDVESGVPLAGHIYTSQNQRQGKSER